MEFVGDVARKTGDPSLLAVEAAKTEKAGAIGRDSGLFYVPKVLNFDAKTGELSLERVRGLATLLEMAVRKDGRVPGLLRRAGEALAAIHEHLVLSDEMKHELPPEWMDSSDENVFIHGDFTLRNVCFHEPSGQLVILDWSAAPLLGEIPAFASRYFDILWLVSYVFSSTPIRGLLSWNAEGMADAFLKGYAKNCSSENSNRFKDYSSKICRLQRKKIWHQARLQRSFLRAVAHLLCQLFMYGRLYVFLHGYQYNKDLMQ